ncbi:homeobox goosecoid [Paramuricea clavata]|uniref:Homeobox goosecoid n=1 Tax=Paramuricea clavata TaxID=317549 RepID=A0A7D9EKJ3_PARCT|nr:homeobox goosecoid [Paramuricea clavata]
MACPFSIHSIDSILAGPTHRPNLVKLKPATVHIQPWQFIINPRQSTGSTELRFSPFPLSTRKRRKRYRTIFSETQIELLEELYKTTQYPDLYQRESVALQAGLHEDRVEVWFKNRRARARKVKRAIEKKTSEAKNNENIATEKEKGKAEESEKTEEENIANKCHD